MSSPAERVTASLLRGWGLPDPGDSKKSRGEVVIVGGSRTSPGAALLAGEASLRVGAGRVALAVPQSIDAHVGIALPEAGVLALPDDAGAPLEGRLRDQIASADAVLVGSGFSDADETRATLSAVAAVGPGILVLDAFALGVLADVDRSSLPENLVLNPNKEEASILLRRDLGEDDEADVREIADRYAAVVNCYGVVAHPDGRVWRVDEGDAGLATSGSGDVLAGAITGFAARGLDPAHAAVWAAWTHGRAGRLLGARFGLGYLARELARELPAALRAVAP
ncbi:NAD(P)H-hydrate dehydratase [Microbacterium sp. NPDC056569]|uniref:NAD(P)H-hydrate dehydratase n=1 Tax=Microbacterium sp. NPDC056569 TaxID=3345867 RepID=UPI00366DA756